MNEHSSLKPIYCRSEIKTTMLQSKQMGKRENKSVNIEGRTQFDLILVSCSSSIECRTQFDLILVSCSSSIEGRTQFDLILVSCSSSIEGRTQFDLILVSCSSSIEGRTQFDLILVSYSSSIEGRTQFDLILVRSNHNHICLCDFKYVFNILFGLIRPIENTGDFCNEFWLQIPVL